MHKNTRKVKTRIKKAFQKLFQNKIIASPDFLCCNNCGANEMARIMDKDGFIGFAFYHAQDTEMLNETGECYISFGNDLETGLMVALALVKEKLDVFWDKTIETRILVKINEV